MNIDNENIRQLLEMLDNPEAYTEQEILDIINRDEYTRETYRMMVEAKRTRQIRKPVDVDAAWQRLSQKHQPTQQRFGWLKIAAAFIGVLLISGIAYAVIQIVSHQQQTQETEEAVAVADASLPMHNASPLVTPNDTAQAVVFDNITLDEMLPQIAAYYNKEVVFRNSNVRQLRFYFVWKPKDKIEVLVKKLNHFESLSVELKDNKIVVE
ncbi:MAG: DUF4974 domain-containing protein [Bacteroidaceae bacterium]|nr:DUF4974 domain-containing protein [Bacteroidaceae bacterium]